MILEELDEISGNYGNVRYYIATCDDDTLIDTLGSDSDEVYGFNKRRENERKRGKA